MNETKIVLYDSDEAASFRTNISGWVSRQGRFYGEQYQAEHLARRDGCTHIKCDCGELIEKRWIRCKACRDAKALKSYNNAPEKEWDGKAMLYSPVTDTYYSSPDEPWEDDEFDENANPMLYICEPNTLCTVDESNLGIDDILPEDASYEDCVPEDVKEAIDNLNKAIRENQQAISWSPGKYKLSQTPTDG